MNAPPSTEALVRLGAFFGVFAVLAAAELAWPKRTLRIGRRRWPANLGLVAVDTLLVRILVPLPAAAVAVVAQQRGWGLLHHLNIPFAVAVVASVVALDFVIYAQHVLFHAVPLLWRLHKVHHADLDLDVSTGLRFHPVEILLSMGIKIAAVALLGTPAVAVVVFEVLLNATAMFNHSNLALPAVIDRGVRLLVVTPDMHRVHHSVHRDETDSNFGFITIILMYLISAR